MTFAHKVAGFEKKRKLTKLNRYSYNCSWLDNCSRAIFFVSQLFARRTVHGAYSARHKYKSTSKTEILNEKLKCFFNFTASFLYFQDISVVSVNAFVGILNAFVNNEFVITLTKSVQDDLKLEDHWFPEVCKSIGSALRHYCTVCLSQIFALLHRFVAFF